MKLFPADNTFRTDNQSPIETLQQSLEAPHSGDYPNTPKIDMELAIRPHKTGMSDSAGLVTEREFARTYDGDDYDDAWEAVEQYRRAITYHADNPDAGIGELVIDDGGTPAAVQGLYTAHKHRWIGVTYDEITPLNVLAAYVYSSGTISSHNYHPSFTLADGDSMVTNTLELMDIGYRDIERPGENRDPAVGPAEDAAVLGRVLSVLGVPVGRKTEIDDLSLPWYLEDAPASVRKRFVDIYCQNRAQPKPDNAGLTIIEERSQSYREELAALIESVSGERVNVTDNGVMISADAARALGIAH